MNLNIENKLFIVGGATSGFGQSVTKRLVEEGAKVIAVARTKEKLDQLAAEFPYEVEIFPGDITSAKTIEDLYNYIENRPLEGILVNAAGPPAKTFAETTLEDWDNAYNNLIKWKVLLTKKFMPIFEKQQYGRFLYIESMSVKQPLENLVLSTSMRLAVVGFVKSLAQDMAPNGITMNILAPGCHLTPAVDRLFNKKSKDLNITYEEAMQSITNQIPVANMGNPDDFASLAVWLLSPLSSYITGQTISVDGGLVKYIFG